MKIVVCGDTHIGADYRLGGANGQGGNTRFDDYEKTLNHIVDHCIENEVDVFVQTGDVFDKRQPTAEQMEIVNRALERLSLNNIFSVILMGNHDYIKKVGNNFVSSLSALAAKNLSNIKIILDPELISVSNNGEKVNLLLLPFRDRKLYGSGNVIEDSMLYEEEVKTLASDAQDGPLIAIGHNAFYEGDYTKHQGSEILARVEAFKKCDMVVMGHIHEFRIVKKVDPIAIYVGSMERLNFGDTNSKKYFIEYDTKTRKTQIIKTPVRDLWDGSINLESSSIDSLGEDLEGELNNLQIDGKIVRLKIIIQDQLSFSIKKSAVEKKLYELGAHYVSDVGFDHIYPKLVRDTSILENKDDFSIFNSFVKNQNLDSDLEKRILLEARSIIGD
jgi:exonuclease SbcD